MAISLLHVSCAILLCHLKYKAVVSLFGLSPTLGREQFMDDAVLYVWFFLFRLEKDVVKMITKVTVVKILTMQMMMKIEKISVIVTVTLTKSTPPSNVLLRRVCSLICFQSISVI